MLTVTEKKLTESRKNAKILADNRKSHHPIETLCVVVRSRGADRVRTLSVDHSNFTRIDFDEFFKCRTEYRILKYEHVKKYTFKVVKN